MKSLILMINLIVMMDLVLTQVIMRFHCPQLPIYNISHVVVVIMNF